MPRFGGTLATDEEQTTSEPKGGRFGGRPADIAAPQQETIDVPTYDPMSGAGGFVQERVSTRKTADPMGVGTKAAVMEPIYGIGEYIPGEIGRASARKARELEQEYQKSAAEYPVATRVGYFGTTGAGLLAGGALPRALGLAGAAVPATTRAAQVGQTALSGAKGGALFGAAQPTGVEDYGARLQQKGLYTAGGAAFGGLLAGAGSAIYQGTGAVKDYLRKALGRDASKAEQDLITKAVQAGKDASQVLSAEEKQILQRLEQETLRAQTAATEATKAAEKVPGALAGPAGRTEETLGVFQRGAPTLDEVGTFIRDRVKSFVDNIKATRNANADRNITEAMQSATAKEAAGDAFLRNPEMVRLRAYLDEALTREVDPAVRRDLQVVKDALFVGVRGPQGEIKVLPSFEGSETIRRKLGDAAFGLQAEGYEAIGQNYARELYGRLSDAMKAYEPKFAKYLDNYRKLSENIENVGTKLGKVLVGMEKDAPAYYATAARSIPDKAFSSPENVRILIEAMGGNREPVLAAAERYLANKMAEAGTLEKARSFLTKDSTRSLLKELGADFEKRIKDKYLTEAATLSKRSEALVAEGKRATEQLGLLGKQLEDVRKRSATLNTGLTRIDAAVSDKAKRDAAASLIADLEKEVPPQEFARLSNLIEQYKDASTARTAAMKKLGITAATGTSGAFGTYYGGKWAAEKLLGD